MPDPEIIKAAILTEIRLLPGEWVSVPEVLRRLRDVLVVNTGEVVGVLRNLVTEQLMEERLTPAGVEYRVPSPVPIPEPIVPVVPDDLPPAA